MISSQLDEPVLYTSTSDEMYDAPTCFKRSLDYFKDGDSQRDRAITLWRWAQHELTKGNKKNGAEMQQEAEEILQSLKLPLVLEHLKAQH